MKKIELLPSSLSAVEHLRIDVDQGAIKFYTLPDAPTGIFHPEYSAKCYTFAAAVSGSGAVDYLVVLALRPDWAQTGDGKVIDIDTAAFCFKTDDLKAAPSGAALFHQNFDGRTTPITGYESFTLESTVNDLHAKLIPGSTPLSAVPDYYINAITHSIAKFNEVLAPQVSGLSIDYNPPGGGQQPRSGENLSTA
jgi:hypothetical protein